MKTKLLYLKYILQNNDLLKKIFLKIMVATKTKNNWFGKIKEYMNTIKLNIS